MGCVRTHAQRQSCAVWSRHDFVRAPRAFCACLRVSAVAYCVCNRESLTTLGVSWLTLGLDMMPSSVSPSTQINHSVFFDFLCHNRAEWFRRWSEAMAALREVCSYLAS